MCNFSELSSSGLKDIYFPYLLLLILRILVQIYLCWCQDLLTTWTLHRQQPTLVFFSKDVRNHINYCIAALTTLFSNTCCRRSVKRKDQSNCYNLKSHKTVLDGKVDKWPKEALEHSCKTRPVTDETAWWVSWHWWLPLEWLFTWKNIIL